MDGPLLQVPLIHRDYGSINSTTLPPHAVFPTTKTRFYVLFVFFLACFVQGITWTPLSALPEAVMEFWPCMSSTLIYWSLNVACIIFLPMAFVSPMLLVSPNGLQRTLRAGIAFSFLSAAVRVPCAMGDAEFRESGLCATLLMIGGVFCGMAGPFTQGSPSRLSAQWFPENERARATAVAYLGTYLGSGASYVISPAIVRSPHDIPKLIWFEVALAAIPAICATVFLPDSPHPTGRRLHHNSGGTNEGVRGCRSFRETLDEFTEGLVQLLHNRAFLLITVSAGTVHGVFATWGASLAMTLGPVGFNDASADWLAFATTTLYVVGSYVGGEIADRFFHRKFKVLLVALLALTVGTFALFGASVPSVLAPRPLIGASYSFEMLAICMHGFFCGSSAPVFMELAADVSYPVPEGTSANLISLVINFAHSTGFFFFPYLSPLLINPICLGIYVVAALVFLPTREAYLRPRSV